MSYYEILYQGQPCAVFNFVGLIREIADSGAAQVSAHYNAGMIDSAGYNDDVKTWFEA